MLIVLCVSKIYLWGFQMVIEDLPSSALPVIVVQATGLRLAYASESNSIPSESSMEVSMMALNPKIFCLRFGFWGFRRTPILASISEGSLGHRKKKESVRVLSPIANLVSRPLLRIKWSPALWSFSVSPKIWLKMLGLSAVCVADSSKLASSRQSVKTSTLGRWTSSGKLGEGHGNLRLIFFPARSFQGFGADKGLFYEHFRWFLWTQWSYTRCRNMCSPYTWHW